MGCVDGAMGHGRQRHEWMHQHQHNYSEHSREHERTPDPPTPQHEWIPSTPEAAGTSHRLPTATGPLAASTPGFAHVVSGQILKEHWVPNNISGALENDSECQMVTPADDDHNADAEIAHNISLEDTGLAEEEYSMTMATTTLPITRAPAATTTLLITRPPVATTHFRSQRIQMVLMELPKLSLCLTEMSGVPACHLLSTRS